MRYVGVAALVAAMAFTVPAMAQTATGPGAGNTGGRAAFATANGKLTKIDGQTLTISVTAEGATKEVVVTCNEQTRIFKGMVGSASAPKQRGGAPAKLEDLKVGQGVMVGYSVGETNTARFLRIISEPAAPASGAGEAATTK